MIDDIFWTSAVVAYGVALVFALKHRERVSSCADPVDFVLARGQEKDNWLTCAAVWSIVLSGQWAGREILQTVGAAVLTWTAWRSVQRLRILLGHRA
jgi:hypothetical protein